MITRIIFGEFCKALWENMITYMNSILIFFFFSTVIVIGFFAIILTKAMSQWNTIFISPSSGSKSVVNLGLV